MSVIFGVAAGRRDFPVLTADWLHAVETARLHVVEALPPSVAAHRALLADPRYAGDAELEASLSATQEALERVRDAADTDAVFAAYFGPERASGRRWRALIDRLLTDSEMSDGAERTIKAAAAIGGGYFAMWDYESSLYYGA